jgi:hypothetical protein
MFSEGTKALYASYREHLGGLRYDLLLRVQAILTPEHVRDLLGLKSAEWMRPVLQLYPRLIHVGLRSVIQELLLPSRYAPAIRGLEHRPEYAGRRAYHDVPLT